MNRPSATILAFALIAAAGTASAQSLYLQEGYGGQEGYGWPGRYDQSHDAHYDYARVLRVDPVFDRYRNQPVSGRRCYQRDTYLDPHDSYGGPDHPGGYAGDGRGDDYYDNDYRGSYDPYDRYPRSGGSEGGRTVATVIGGVLGAVIGSQVGGGSARYATSAIGTMVGGVAGREIYEHNQRTRRHTGTVRVCDPVPVDGYHGAGVRAVSAYDVTYEYAGRSYVTRTDYHPGDRIRVRVDVRPE
ncbi:glycine zipper 2TM domain-containing protein [Lysobacter sp. D1-1-M9]|uniref:glycine zipper 2TM domain-containing protein n=1 Tax=Novilysobacter longmucuonensis TaxID=3098603 RepID=UPI002FC8B1D4